ncbi:unnamed protein product [Microthlaspi erraticum]|uniref:F-box domain-containing protein n=1 Tax=Microthlaspi erraticum TaxID=1685480 RepID=A0A6D2I891_9BRAS|nr:unnamed protein product [Microthlaspi erraticum]
MDRVSNLPDELLHQILSFLPTKDAAVTSVLSERWLNLWKLNPNLDIDDTDFLRPEDGKGERAEIRQSFVDFVDSVLARQGDSPIKKFSLSVSLRCLLYAVNRCLCSTTSEFLGVSGQEGRGWQAMPALLRNCPRLETIIVQGLIHDVTDKCGDACPCISREDRGLSLKSCPVNRFDVFVEDDEPTQLRNTELFNCVVEMFKSTTSCRRAAISSSWFSDFLEKKWKAQGHI